MPLTISPMTPGFAAEIYDVDLSAPLSADEIAAVKEAFWSYGVLIFPDQHLSQEQHLDFARLFGPLETTVGVYRKDAPLRVRPEFADVSNLNHKGVIWGEKSRLRAFMKGNQLWHTDSSFKYLPALTSLLYARTVPPYGGHTEFADERAAYDALPEAMKARLEGLVAMHSLMTSRARLGFTDFTEQEHESMPTVPQMMVRTIPESGRATLYLASHIGAIQGLPDDEAAALVDELIAHAGQRQFVYTHRWRVDDLVMWDDRCTMHRGIDFDDMRFVRDVQRATVSDIANTCEQAGVLVAESA